MLIITTDLSNPARQKSGYAILTVKFQKVQVLLKADIKHLFAY